MMATAFEVHSYVVDRWLPEDKGPGVELAFMQEGADEQLHLLMSEPLAWQIASKIIGILGVPPLTPDDEGWERL